MTTEILNTFYSKATRVKEISTLELKLLKIIHRELKKLESNDLLALSNRREFSLIINLFKYYQKEMNLRKILLLLII